MWYRGENRAPGWEEKHGDRNRDGDGNEDEVRDEGENGSGNGDDSGDEGGGDRERAWEPSKW